MSAKSRVLVVDDDASVGKVLSAILAQAGCESLHAESVDKALQLLRAKSIDLVISDLRMPGTDGFGMLEQLRKQWPDVPLIMLTAHGTVQIAVAAMRGGAFDFMLKPFEREEVVATVQRALDATAARRQAPPRLPQIGEGFFGSSAALAELVQRLERAASGSATVLRAATLPVRCCTPGSAAAGARTSLRASTCSAATPCCRPIRTASSSSC